MNIKGLTYNTARKPLILPEYGREIQKMVDIAVSLPTKRERQVCANTIINTMIAMFPQGYQGEELERRMWDHLAIMSNFQLDIDFPFGIDAAAKMTLKPDTISYPRHNIRVRHYGRLMIETMQYLKDMPVSEERDRLIDKVLMQMRRLLNDWGHGTVDAERIVSDLAMYTDGRIQIDPSLVRFERTFPTSNTNSGRGRKRKK